MELDVSYSLDNEQQFWDELQEIVSAQCTSEDLIDNALRAYLSFTTKYKDEYLNSDYDISRCSYKLFSSSIFAAHADYVRRQIIYCLLQEDDLNTLHLIASFLFFDGRQNETTFQMMNEEGSFPRLLELIQLPKSDDTFEAGLHRLLMDLLYEMSRIQRIKLEDLVLVDDDFVKYLFEIIEQLSYDANDPYHYPVIRVLLVLNEQFMVLAHDPTTEEHTSSSRLTNKVIKVLSMYGNAYKTFGENIILLLNREGETSLQLLTLKLLYLIFTTPPTYEYFYTNDLRVLVDILIRNLLDLPEESSALRHTYLRVLYPLLAHTQLRYPPYYKREEVKRMLGILVHGQFQGGEEDSERILHFNDVDETTKRLVARCGKVEWLQDPEPVILAESPSDIAPDADNGTLQPQSPDTVVGEPLEGATSVLSTTTATSSPDSSSPTRFVEQISSKTSSSLDPQQAEILGPYLEPSRSSSLSAVEVAMHQEQPGIMTPSIKDALAADALPGQAATVKPKIKPEPPKARRARGRRPREEDESSSKAPEGVELKVNGQEERRDSVGEHYAPPAPPHAYRSVSHHPPAVPPPRRSSHSVHPHTPTSSSGSLPGVTISPHRHGQKPEPPKTRRWGRGRHLQPESVVKEHKAEAETPQESKEPIVVISTQSGEIHESPVSIEEVMQKISIE